MCTYLTDTVLFVTCDEEAGDLSPSYSGWYELRETGRFDVGGVSATTIGDL